MKQLLTLCLVLALTVSVSAQWPYKKTADDVTVGAVAIALFSASQVNGAGHVAATVATCALTGGNIRVTYDGTTPTTNLGLVVTPGIYTVTGTDIMLNSLGIRDDSSSGTWSCVLQGS